MLLSKLKASITGPLFDATSITCETALFSFSTLSSTTNNALKLIGWVCVVYVCPNVVSLSQVSWIDSPSPNSIVHNKSDNWSLSSLTWVVNVTFRGEIPDVWSTEIDASGALSWGNENTLSILLKSCLSPSVATNVNTFVPGVTWFDNSNDELQSTALFTPLILSVQTISKSSGWVVVQSRVISVGKSNPFEESISNVKIWGAEYVLSNTNTFSWAVTVCISSWTLSTVLYCPIWVNVCSIEIKPSFCEHSNVSVVPSSKSIVQVNVWDSKSSTSTKKLVVKGSCPFVGSASYLVIDGSLLSMKLIVIESWADAPELSSTDTEIVTVFGVVVVISVIVLIVWIDASPETKDVSIVNVLNASLKSTI